MPMQTPLCGEFFSRVQKATECPRTRRFFAEIAPPPLSSPTLFCSLSSPCLFSPPLGLLFSSFHSSLLSSSVRLGRAYLLHTQALFLPFTASAASGASPARPLANVALSRSRQTWTPPSPPRLSCHALRFFVFFCLLCFLGGFPRFFPRFMHIARVLTRSLLVYNPLHTCAFSLHLRPAPPLFSTNLFSFLCLLPDAPSFLDLRLGKLRAWLFLVLFLLCALFCPPLWHPWPQSFVRGTSSPSLHRSSSNRPSAAFFLACKPNVATLISPRTRRERKRSRCTRANTPRRPVTTGATVRSRASARTNGRFFRAFFFSPRWRPGGTHLKRTHRFSFRVCSVRLAWSARSALELWPPCLSNCQGGIHMPLIRIAQH